jgi:hypothetical protein
MANVSHAMQHGHRTTHLEKHPGRMISSPFSSTRAWRELAGMSRQPGLQLGCNSQLFPCVFVNGVAMRILDA